MVVVIAVVVAVVVVVVVVVVDVVVVEAVGVAAAATIIMSILVDSGNGSILGSCMLPDSILNHRLSHIQCQSPAPPPTRFSESTGSRPISRERFSSSGCLSFWILAFYPVSETGRVTVGESVSICA